MEAIKMIQERRSVRKYKNEKVSRELMREIVDLAKWAPSWANFQIARYTIIDNEEIIQRIATEGVHNFSYNTGTLLRTKGIVVLSYVLGKSGKKGDDEGYVTQKNNEWEMFDAGIACQTFCLAAHAKGVGTCIFGIIDDEFIGKLIQLPENETVAAIISFGFEEGEHANPTPRKEVNDIIRFV